MLENSKRRKISQNSLRSQISNLRKTQENTTSLIYEIKVKKVEGIFRLVKIAERVICDGLKRGCRVFESRESSGHRSYAFNRDLRDSGGLG